MINMPDQAVIDRKVLPLLLTDECLHRYTGKKIWFLHPFLRLFKWDDFCGHGTEPWAVRWSAPKLYANEKLFANHTC